jgi:aminoglycoside 6'-N-acetyltransferase I
MMYSIHHLDPRHGEAAMEAAAMLLQAFPNWLRTREEALGVVADALAPDRLCLTARSGADVFGWIGGIPAYSHAWELHPLVVRADVRGQGIGRALVAALEERLRDRGVLTLYLGTDDDGPAPGTSAGGIELFPDPLAHAAGLTVRDHPVGFYRRLGFTVVGLIPDANGPGKPDILMAKHIGSAL